MINKAIQWKKTHPKGYRLVVERCLLALNNGDDEIYLSALLFELVRDKKIYIEPGMGNSLACLIQADHPELKNKFHIRRQVSVRDEKTEILHMLQKIMSI